MFIVDCFVEGCFIFVDFVVFDIGDFVIDVEIWLCSVFGIFEVFEGGVLFCLFVVVVIEDVVVGVYFGESLGVEKYLLECLCGGIWDG